MKYDDATVLGLNWAGNVDVAVPYDWDPATHVPTVQESAILGVEAPIWSETIATLRRPRVPRVPASGRGRRSGMVAAKRQAVDGVSRAARRASTAMGGARDQRVLVTENRLAALALYSAQHAVCSVRL